MLPIAEELVIRAVLSLSGRHILAYFLILRASILLGGWVVDCTMAGSQQRLSLPRGAFGASCRVWRLETCLQFKVGCLVRVVQPAVALAATPVRANQAVIPLRV